MRLRRRTPGNDVLSRRRRRPGKRDGSINAAAKNYTRYFLPFCIVAVPYLWKWLLDLHPDSEERIATLEVEAEYNAQWRRIQREQNLQVVNAFRQGMNSPRVREAIMGLTEKAAIQSA